MAVVPGDQKALAAEVLRMYREAELEVLKTIAERVRSGLEGDKFLDNRLRDTRLIQERTKEIMEATTGKMEDEVPKVIISAYEAAMDEIDADLATIPIGRQKIAQASIVLGGQTPGAIIALAQSAISQLRTTTLPILRSATDIFRQVQNHAVSASLTS